MTRPLCYEDVRNPNLPWGYWLRDVRSTGSSYPLEDEQGRGWESVRDCFWRSHLGLPDCNARDKHRTIEFILAILVATDRRIIGTEEKVSEYFNRNWELARLMDFCLAGWNLVHPPTHAGGGLTVQGRAVLQMLASTRDIEAAPLPIGLPTLRQWRGLVDSAGLAPVEEIVRMQEQFSQHLPFRFVRSELRHVPMIGLQSEPVGDNVPLKRTLWSLAFPDLPARERMYLWLHERLDRWQDWGELAYRQGGAALTELLLHHAFLDRLPGEVKPKKGRGG
jgi:hypothetical protein